MVNEDENGDGAAERFAELLQEARLALAIAPENALILTEQCIQIADAVGNFSDKAAACRVRGQAFRALGRHQPAIDAFSEAATAARAANDPLLAAQVQVGAIDSFTMLGRPRDAATLAAELIRTFNELGSSLDAAKALCNLGSLYLRQDRYTDALKCYTEADTDFEQVESNGGASNIALMRALVSVNRALALTHLNDVEAALRLYESARDTYTRFEMEGEAAVVETNIAFLHHVSGWYAAALAHLNRAHLVFVAQGKVHEAARCNVDRGEAYRSLNLFPEALQCYEQAQEFFVTLPVGYDHARAEIGKAATLFALSRVTEGLKSLEQAEVIFRHLRNPVQQAHVHLIRAGWLYAAGQTEKARALAVQCVPSFTRRRLFGWAAEARFLVAKIDIAQDTDGIRRMQAVTRAAQQTRRGWLECRAEQALGLAEKRRGRTTQALHHYRRGIAVLESARTLLTPDEMYTAYLSDKLDIYSETVSLLLESGLPADLEEALDYAERSRSRLLLERIAASQERLPSSDSPDGNLSRLRAALARAQQGINIQDASDPRRFVNTDSDQISELELAFTEAVRAAQLDGILSPKTGMLREAVASQEPVSLASLQSELQQEETLISFYALSDSFVAFLITAQGLKIVRLNVTPEEVTRTARRLRYHLQKMQIHSAGNQTMIPLRDALRAEIDGVLKQFYEHLLKPLEANLAEGSRLIIVPFGELHGLPFHAFYDGATYAADRWDITYAPSASVWHRLMQTAGSKEGQVVESSNVRTVLVSVPGPGIERVASEVEVIRQTIPNAQVFVGANATAEQIIPATATASVLHIAAHAEFRKDNPQFSAILLTDGWLLARDVYDMNLPSTLVILSACETAMSQIQSGDELFGLIRAFLTAGARAVVGSFWPADDEATAELMTRFYRNREQGFSDSSALRLAQKEIRTQYPHPYHWAAFGLIGIGKSSQKG